MVRAHRDGECVSHDPVPARSDYRLMLTTLASAAALERDMIAWAIPVWFLINCGILEMRKGEGFTKARNLCLEIN